MLKKVESKKEDIFRMIKEAGREILKIYQGNDFQVEIKRDKTPLTIADKRSNQVILQGLGGIIGKRKNMWRSSRENTNRLK